MYIMVAERYILPHDLVPSIFYHRGYMMNELLKSQIEAFKAHPVFSPQDGDKPVSRSRSPDRSTYFGFILYPEDPDHMKMLDYIQMKQFYRYVYIFHDRDTEEDLVTPKKPHYHIMIKTLDRLTSKSVVDWFGGWVDHAEVIHSPKSYVLYMLHTSPREINKLGNHVYDISDLRGHDQMWKGVCVQNGHFVQLGELLSYQPFRGTFFDTFKAIPDSRKVDLGQFMWDNRFFIQSVLKEESLRWIEVPIDHEFVYSAPIHSSNGVQRFPGDISLL